MLIEPAILSPLLPLFGALIGGCALIVAAIYTQHTQNRWQRIASEVAKREMVYGDFVTSASKLILNFPLSGLVRGGRRYRSCARVELRVWIELRRRVGLRAWLRLRRRISVSLRSWRRVGLRLRVAQRELKVKLRRLLQL
jgi:hypothetical protein